MGRLDVSAPVDSQGESWCTLTWPSEGRYTFALGPAARVECRVWGVSQQQAAYSVAMWLIPAALPLLDLEPLHGAALATATSGVLLLGASGAGKTTLSIQLQHRGFDFLADDVCALDSSGNLHAGALLQSVAQPKSGAEVVDPYDGKWLVRPARPRLGCVPATHTAILAPAAGALLATTPLEGVSAFRAIAQHIRHRRLFAARRQAGQLAVISLLCDRAVARLTYDPRDHSPGAVGAELARWISNAAEFNGLDRKHHSSLQDVR